ncbi:MAG: ERF family protein [Thermoleophilia bacterium]
MATTTAPASPPDDGGHVPHPDAGTGSLAQRLARIMGALQRIERDGAVTGSGGYSYASADQLSDVLRPALAAEGVVMLPTDTQVIDQRVDEVDKGSYTQTRYTVALRVEWVLSDGETEYRMATVGTGVDYAGKAANAAHTFARVNAFKSAFHLSTGDDPEAHQGSLDAGGTEAWRRHNQQRTGELPTIPEGADVTGALQVGKTGIGIKHRADDRAVFDAIKDAAKGIPGARWNGDAKAWVVPESQAGAAVVLARHVGLTIPDDLAQRFPPPASDDLPTTDETAGATGNGTPDDDIPF